MFDSVRGSLLKFTFSSVFLRTMAFNFDWYGKICSWICSPYSTQEVRDVIQDGLCSTDMSVALTKEKDDSIAKEQRALLVPNLCNSMLFQHALPELLPFTDFMSLRAVSKQYSQISAFHKLLRVQFPKKMLNEAQSECVSVYDLEERFRIPTRAKINAEARRLRQEEGWEAELAYVNKMSMIPPRYNEKRPTSDRERRTGFCCPSDRVTFRGSCCGYIIKGRGFRSKNDESFQALQRERFYQMRQRDGNSVVKWCQDFLWGLGNIELCCLSECRDRVARDSFFHRMVDSRCCIPAKYDEGEYVIPHYYDESTWM